MGKKKKGHASLDKKKTESSTERGISFFTEERVSP